MEFARCTKVPINANYFMWHFTNANFNSKLFYFDLSYFVKIPQKKITNFFLFREIVKYQNFASDS